MTTRRHVALMIETSSSYGRQVLKGIVRYMRVHDQWSVFLDERDLTRNPPAWLRSWKGDGIISRSTTPALLRIVARNSIPLLELTDRSTRRAQPHLRADDLQIGALGAQHLIERGFRHFGFCGFANEAWSARREQGFRQQVQAAGYDVNGFLSPWFGADDFSWKDQQKQLAQWLMSMPRPCGVMCCNDVRAQHVLDVCHTQQIAVPEQVAVLGVDNDELLCRVCSPPLSSVIPNAEAVGYQAAERLEEMMSGRAVERGHLVAPLGVAERPSTDIVAIDDPVIADALRYIRHHACDGCSVDDVVRNVNVSRSTLERQLRKYLGRTPQQQIRHVQIRRVCELLATTDASVDQIALQCGFQHSEYMHVVFKRLRGLTPGAYRQQAEQVAEV